MSRYFLGWLGVTVFMLAGSSSADEPLRVMSFNIRFGTANDGDNRWETRDQLVLQTIRDFKPDLLGTQETLKFQAEFLKENLKDYGVVGRSREQDPEKGEQCTIFFRQARFALLEQGQFWLSETPDEVASKSWDSSLPRIATWVKLKDKLSGRTFYFLNTHFDHIGKTARLEGARLIARQVAEFKAPTVITGDFNCGGDSPPYQALVKTDEVDLQDTYRVVHPDKKPDEGTFNGFRGFDQGARIDWVLATREWKVSGATIDKTNDQGKYPSDHFPVTATLQLR